VENDSTLRNPGKDSSSNDRVKIRQCGWRLYEDLPRRPDKYRCCGGQAGHQGDHRPTNGGPVDPKGMWVPGLPVTGIAEFLVDQRAPLYACQFRDHWVIELYRGDARFPFRSVAWRLLDDGRDVCLPECWSASAVEALHLARDQVRDWEQVQLFRAEGVRS